MRRARAETIAVTDPAAPGGQRTLDYRIYARAECVLCHNPWVEKKTTIFGLQSASPLGLNTPQMNRELHVWRAARSTSSMAFQRDGARWRWTPDPGQAPPTWSIPTTSPADLEPPGAVVSSRSTARTAISSTPGARRTSRWGSRCPLDETKTVGVRPIQGTFNITGARIIAPGDPDALGALLPRSPSSAAAGCRGSGRTRSTSARSGMIHDWIAGMRPTERAGSSARIAKADAEDRAALEVAPTQADRSSHRGARRGDPPAGLIDARGPHAAEPASTAAPVSADLRREVVAITRNSPQVEVRDLFERFIPEGERIKRLGDVIDRAALLALRGDAERGQAVFATNPAAQCKTCHKVGPIGETVGPDLSKIGTKYDRAAMLEQILEPSKTIDPQYVSYLVETKDGQVVTGVVDRANRRGGRRSRTRRARRSRSLATRSNSSSPSRAR